MQHPAVQPISFLILSTVPSGSPGSLSLSLSAKTTKLSPVILQALSLSLAKVTYSQIQTTTLPCTATATRPHAAQLLTLISCAHHSCKRLNLATFVTCQKMLSLRKLNLNAHSNLSELCDIDQVCGLSIPRIGTVVRFPGSSSYPWAWVLCLVDWHSTARPRSMAKAIPTRQSLFVSGVWCSSIFPFPSICQAIGRVLLQSLHCPTRHHECWYGYPFVPQTVQDYFSFWASTLQFQSKSSGYSTLKLMKFPGSCRSLHLPKHSICVSRVYSQL